MKALIESCYYKANYEHRKWPWQKGYGSWKIAQHARGGHSHEELLIVWDVLDEYVRRFGVASLADDVLEVAWAGCEDVCFSSSERDGGCRFKFATEVLKNPYKWDRLPSETDLDGAVKILTFCIEQDGKKYDWPGVSGFKLSFITEDTDRWYCSEVCDTAKSKAKRFPVLYQYHPSESYRIQQFITSQMIKLDAFKQPSMN